MYFFVHKCAFSWVLLSIHRSTDCASTEAAKPETIRVKVVHVVVSISQASGSENRGDDDSGRRPHLIESGQTASFIAYLSNTGPANQFLGMRHIQLMISSIDADQRVRKYVLPISPYRDLMATARECTG